MNYLLVFLVASLAFCLSAIAGGGAGLILIPVLSLVLDPMFVPVALTLGTTTSSVSRIAAFFRFIEWKIVRWVVLASVPGVVAGGYLLTLLDPVYVELCLSLFLVSNVVMLFRPDSSNPETGLHSRWLLLVGFLVGLVSALTGAVGVLFNRIYFRYGLTAQSIVATRAANEVVVHLLKLYLYARLGLLTAEAVSTGLVVAAAALISVVIVRAYLHQLPQQAFRSVGYLAMVVSGVVMLNTAASGIMDQHHPRLNAIAKADGGDLQLGWNDMLYTLEFSFDEGFEFEKTVELAALSASHQLAAAGQCVSNERLYIEAVYSPALSQYEVHCFDQSNHLIRKVKLQVT